MINLTILGEPRPKQSARFYSKNGKMFSYQPKEIKENEQSIKWQVINQLPKGFKPYTKSVIIEKAVFVFAPLKGFSKRKLSLVEREQVYKATKPDLQDNIFKLVIDSLEGIIFLNDSQIVEIRQAKKIYGFTPRIELIFSEVDNDT